MKLSNCAWAGLQIFKICMVCTQGKYRKSSSDFPVCVILIVCIKSEESHVSASHFSVTGTKERHHFDHQCPV